MSAVFDDSEPEPQDPWTIRGSLAADAPRWIDARRPRAFAERHPSGDPPRPRRPWRLPVPARRAVGLDLSDAQAETMDALLSAGVSATTTHAYLDSGWDGTECVPWALFGLDPTQARVYRAIGFAPREGAALAERGDDALELMCAWWDAGVPRGEVVARAANTGPADAAARPPAGPPTSGR